MNGGRVRLLQLVHGYPPAIGGVERSTRDLCEALVSEHAFDVTVITTNALTISRFNDASQPTIPILEDEVQHGVRILRFPVDTRFGGTLRQAQRIAWRLRLPGNDTLRTWYNGPRSPAMLAAVQRLEADVVCAASFPLNHMRYPFLTPEPRPPVVLVAAAHTNDAWGFERPYLLRLTRLAFATVAHTEHEREWLVARGAPPERVCVIGHGIDLEGSTPRPGLFRQKQGIEAGGYLVAYLGQLARHKGIDMMVRAFPSLLERRPDTWLAVAGSWTPFAHDLERLVSELPEGPRARVRVVKDLSEQDKADLLGDCDVFASPAEAESFGITTLEAWAMRKPVVVGDTPSQREVVDEEATGLLVPPGDAEALVAALDRLGEDRLRQSLGDAGFQLVRSRYDRRHVERAYADLFREAAASSQRCLPIRSVQTSVGDGMS